MGSNGNQPFYSTQIDLSIDLRTQVASILNRALASTLDLKTQVKQAHWNVKGMDFYQLHELFDEMASELEEFVDMIAERVTALGGTALGTARMAVASSILEDYPLEAIEGKDHIVALAERYAAYGKLVRDDIDETDDLGDADTADLFTEVSRAIDKRLWFLEAHLQTAPVLLETNGSANKSDADKVGKKMAKEKRGAK